MKPLNFAILVFSIATLAILFNWILLKTSLQDKQLISLAIGLNCIFSAGTFFVLRSAISASGYSFIGKVSGTTMVKLFSSILLILAINYVYPKQVITFAIAYFVSYILYTFLEVAILLGILRRFSKTGPSKP
jgi:hypothetical protein